MNKELYSIKKVLFNSGVYSITTILQRAVGFFLLPLYTIYLTPKDYGITGLVTSFTGTLSLLFTLSLNSAVTRFYYDYKDDELKLRKFWGTIVVFISINSVVMCLLIILFRNTFITPLFKGIIFYPYILIGILTLVVTPVYNIYQSILQTKQEAKRFAINSTLQFFFTLVFNILLIVVFRLGAEGQLLASLFAGLIFAVYSIYKLLKRKLIIFTINREYLGESLKYSLPLIPHLMSGIIASLVSRVFLNNEVSTEYVGLFNVGAQFLIILDTLQYSVNNAYIPWFFDLMSKGRSMYYKVINFADFILRANCILSLVLALFIKEVIQIMTSSSYWLAWIMVPVMVIGYQVRGVYLFYVNTLFYNKRATKYIFIATLSGNIMSVILSALLTGKLGLMTPAVVLVIEKTITTVIVVYLSNKFEQVEFKLGRMIAYISILTVATGTGLVFDLQNPTGSIQLFNILYKFLIMMIVGFFMMKSDYKLIKNTIIQISVKNC